MNRSIFWHRRDLRLNDNAGLFHALKSGHKVQPIFIFDTEILGKLQNKADARVQFIHNELQKLDNEYRKYGATLHVWHGNPTTLWPQIISEYKPKKVFCNRDYEPYAILRDKTVFQMLSEQEITMHAYKDHVIFDKQEVVKSDGAPYTVFTPYSRKWKEKLLSVEKDDQNLYLKPYLTENYLTNLELGTDTRMPSLTEIGFVSSDIAIPDRTTKVEVLANYHEKRNFPALSNSTTRLGIHLRFGTVSIRQLATMARSINETYLNELIWRDFYQMILYHFPQTPDKAFKPAYDRIEWRYDEADFNRWCEGNTGYPIVDAGMRELNQTGHMHNRVRMITASFLTKHLLIDWRWGERYFASKLLDFDLASNVGGWQWASGSGCDAAPYFRVFNPTLQTEKFDPQFKYIQKWVPEFETPAYPKPMVEHKFARERAIEVYKAGLS